MEIKEYASLRFKDDNKEKAKHVDAPCENKRHAGSTPATSTILPSLHAISEEETYTWEAAPSSEECQIT